MKREILFCVLLLVFSLSWTLHSAAQKASYRVKTVVIDAGHGGKDSGASSGGVKEKDIALKIALKLGAYITEGLPDVKVIYTRKDDRFIELHRRAAIANEAHADLFISIHCNANRSSNPYGTETYVMGLHKSKANLEVAKKENASILLEDNYENEYQGYDPNLPENTIIFSLFQNAYLNQSLSIASMVEEQFRKRVNRHDRGVKQAGFLVLYRTTMPGILIETGFLTNPSERKFLNSDKGQVYIASAIYRAFKSYKKQQEEENNRVMDCSEEANTSPAKPQEPEPKKESPQPNPISFSVQFLTSKLDNKEFKDLTKVKVYTHGGLFKYVSGEFSTFEEAWQYKKQVVKLGYKDAFVVAFKNNKRIDIKKARALTEP